MTRKLININLAIENKKLVKFKNQILNFQKIAHFLILFVRKKHNNIARLAYKFLSKIFLIIIKVIPFF